MVESIQYFKEWVKSQGYCFYIYQGEIDDSCWELGFGHRSEGFIDDGWDLRDDELEHWNEDEFQDCVHELISSNLIGDELGSCTYEIKNTHIPVVKEYLLEWGFKEGIPGWCD